MGYAQRDQDDATLHLLESANVPDNEAKVKLCCLVMRYGDDKEFSLRTVDLASKWGYSPSMLMLECTEIWSQGHRFDGIQDNIGSANDTQEVS